MNPRRNGNPRYRVQLVGRAADQLAEIIRRAEGLGRMADIRAAYRVVMRQLRTMPREFGEAVAPLSAARIDLFTAAIAPLVVHFGVHQDRPEVFVREFRDLL